jgi:hypothetical protein
MILPAILGAASSMAQGAAANSAAKAQAAVSEQNAHLAELQAADATKRGGSEAYAMKRQLAILQGHQRAMAAVNGVNADSGSMADIQAASALEGERDINANSENRARESWGYDVQAANYRAEASAARASGRNAMFGGAVGAAGSLLSLATPVSSGSGLKIQSRYPDWSDRQLQYRRR